MEQNVMIKLDGLKKYFRIEKGLIKKQTTYVKAVDDITLDIHEGEIVGLVGESGSGKTTLARVILSLSKMTGGSILVDGINLSSATSKDMRKLHSEVAVVFQDPASNLNPRQTVESSIMRPMIIHGVSKAEARKKARDVLDMVKMDQRYLDSYPHQLSGGQLQRIAIARALALNPKVMILDEPTSALDVSVQAQILNLLLDLQEQLHLTYLIIAHDLNVIKYISDRIAVMYLGKLVECGPTKEIAKHPYTKALLDASPILDPKQRNNKKEVIKGDPGSLINLGGGCRFSDRCKYATEECKNEEPETVLVNKNHQIACFHPLDL
ncbi:ABC transporter ATP-binding protein [Aminipila luticellarii]|uniref:ABC transporter ATP-binding protein n=1 Tax=Aminipila luticellarii TaxID=2507160 RepID=A0A410PVK1_9FIRM|nr:ABC transporter ATP-binding protein [Aminipila luticellarii]QAT42971.1 ABC transporter ATP-binding protein [Aminipila luticellarii]